MEKVRNIPHVEGNFSTFFYITIKQTKKIRKLEDDIIIPLLKDFTYEKIDDYHISLSKTFFLKYYQINNFVNDVKKKLANKIKQTILITPKVRYFANEYNNRNFLALEVHKSKNLANLINELTNIISKYDNKYEFHQEDNIPHISLLWSDKSFSTAVQEDLLNEKISKSGNYKPNMAVKSVQIENVYFKIGSKLYKI
jgi:hypothetical protein